CKRETQESHRRFLLFVGATESVVHTRSQWVGLQPLFQLTHFGVCVDTRCGVGPDVHYALAIDTLNRADAGQWFASDKAADRNQPARRVDADIVTLLHAAVFFRVAHADFHSFFTVVRPVVAHQNTVRQQLNGSTNLLHAGA